jgi:hypothetical protein
MISAGISKRNEPRLLHRMFLNERESRENSSKPDPVGNKDPGHVRHRCRKGIMRQSAVILFTLLALSPYALPEKKKIVMEKAKVISQESGSERSGVIGRPIDGMVVAEPIYKNWNKTVIETEQAKYELNELGNNWLVLPAKGVIEFYRDGDLLIILDNKNKKHKFAVVGMMAK